MIEVYFVMALIMNGGIPSPPPHTVRMPSLERCLAKVADATTDLATDPEGSFTFVAGCRIIVTKADPA